jgi:hypothetical protein
VTLDQLPLPISYEDSRTLALVYPYEIALMLYQLQAEHGDPRHVHHGVQLTDGRYCLCGDILSEVGEGGLLHGLFSHVTPEMMEAVEVIPWADAVALMPPSREVDIE